MVSYDALADLVVTIHAAYVGFVMLGFTAIVLGGAMGWRWVRNLYFRLAHLAAILLVCLEGLNLDTVCSCQQCCTRSVHLNVEVF